MANKNERSKSTEPKALIIDDVSQQSELFCECTEPKPLLKDMYDKTTCNTCRKEIEQNCG